MFRDLFRIVLLGIMLTRASVAADLTPPPPVLTGSAQAFTRDGTGRTFITGYFSGTLDLDPSSTDQSVVALGTQSAYVCCFSATGQLAWTKVFGGSNQETPNAVVLIGSTLYVTGSTQSTNAGIGALGPAASTAPGVFVIALDATTGAAATGFDTDGILNYEPVVGGVPGVGRALVTDGTTLYVGSNDENDLYIHAFTTGGAPLGGFTPAQRGGAGSDILNGLAINGTRLYACGSLGNSSFDCVIYAVNAATGAAETGFNSTGTVTFGGTGPDIFQRVVVNSTTGDVYLGGLIGSTNAQFNGAGTSYSFVGSNRDGLVVALTSAGVPLSTFASNGVLIPPEADDAQVQNGMIAADFGATSPGISLATEAGGSSTRDIRLRSYSVAGALDTSFGVNGVISIASDGRDEIWGVVRESGAVHVLGQMNGSNLAIATRISRSALLAIPGSLGSVQASFTLPAGNPLYPYVNAAYPSADVPAGGRAIRIFGGGFDGGTQVTFGGSGTFTSTANSATTLDGLAPAGTGSVAAAFVFSNGRRLTVPSFFRYAAGLTATDPGVVQSGTSGVSGFTLDAQGNKYITTVSNSAATDYNPTSGADIRTNIDSSTGGVLITRINADGSYGWTSQLVGFAATNNSNAIKISGDTVYFAGTLASTLTGINGPGQTAPGGGADAYIAALDRATGAAVPGFGVNGILTFGGTDISTQEQFYGLAVSGSTLYAVGSLFSTNAGFNGTGSIATAGQEDCVVVAVDRTTGAPVNTFGTGGVVKFGGTGIDRGRRISLSDSGTVLAVGATYSGSATLQGGGTVASQGGTDAAVLLLNAATGAPVATFGTNGVATLGGSGTENVRDVLSYNDNTSENVLLLGDGSSLSLAINAGTPIPLTDGTSAFVLKLGSTGAPVTSFGGDGLVILSGSGSQTGGRLVLLPATAAAVAPRQDVAGATFVCTGLTDCNDDSTFNCDGTAVSGFPAAQDNGQGTFFLNLTLNNGTLSLSGPTPTGCGTATNGGFCETTFCELDSDGSGIVAAGFCIGQTTVRTSGVGTTPRTIGVADFSALFVSTDGGSTPPPGVGPTITSPLQVSNLQQGVDFVYTVTATGTPTITYKIDRVVDNLTVLTPLLNEPLFGASLVSATLAGDKLKVNSRCPRIGVSVTITASNVDDGEVKTDTKTEVFSGKNDDPRAPKVTLLPPFFEEGIVKTVRLVEGKTLNVPFEVTGDEPLTIRCSYGPINRQVQSTVNGKTVTVQGNLDGSNIASFFLSAENAFGADAKAFNILVVSADSVDTDNDGLPDFQDLDDDNDGFPDEVEDEIGTLPDDPTSVPSLGIEGSIGLGTTGSVGFKFKWVDPNANSDSCIDQFTSTDLVLAGGNFLSRAAPKPTPGMLIYEIGGVVRMFTIDSKGKGVSGDDKITVKIKSSKGVTSTSVNVNLKNLNLKSKLAGEGFTDRTVKKEPLTVNSFVAYNGRAITRTLTLEYTAKAGKTGSAKLKK